MQRHDVDVSEEGHEGWYEGGKGGVGARARVGWGTSSIGAAPACQGWYGVRQGWYGVRRTKVSKNIPGSKFEREGMGTAGPNAHAVGSLERLLGEPAQILLLLLVRAAHVDWGAREVVGLKCGHWGRCSGM